MWNLWICRADWVLFHFDFFLSLFHIYSMFLCFLSKMFFSNSFSTFDIYSSLFPFLLLRNAFVCCVLSHFSHVWLFATLWTVAHQTPLSMGFSRQEYWSGLPCLRPEDLSDPGIEPISLMSPALASGLFNHLRLWLFYSVSKIYNFFSNNTSQSSTAWTKSITCKYRSPSALS